MKKLTIIIPLYNSEKYIKKCLNSLAYQSFKDFKVILFDNQNKNHEEYVREYENILDIEYISSRENVGWTGSNNKCLKLVNTKYAFLLNIDTHLEKDCLNLLYKFAKEQLDAVLISPEIVEYEDFNYENEGFPLSFDFNTGLISGYKLLDSFTEVNFVPGTAMFIDMKKISLDSPPFNDSFFMYHEDVDFSIRTVLKGRGKLLFVKGPKVAHASKQAFKRFSTCKYAIRNCLYCLSRYQSKFNYIKKMPYYLFVYFKFYILFYFKYYPIAYPLVGIFYIFRSIFVRSENRSIKSFQKINTDIKNKYKLKLSFIF